VIHAFLEQSGIPELQGKARIVRLAHTVCAIPWGEARTVEDVLQKNVGTCTGKHLLFQACCEELGIRYRPVVCTFFWSAQEIKFPENLLHILRGREWEHGHNFVQIQNSDAQWIDVDITWDAPLAPYGFATFPETWDGETSFVGLRQIEKRWEGADVSKKKKEIVHSLSPDQKNRRDVFLKEFIHWIDSLR